jgi:hypothetical protein
MNYNEIRNLFPELYNLLIVNGNKICKYLKFHLGPPLESDFPTSNHLSTLLALWKQKEAFPPNIEPIIPEPQYCTLYTGTKCPHNFWGPEAAVQLRLEKKNPDNF